MVEEAAESAHARGAAAAAAELAELAVRLTPAEDVEDVRRRVLDCADRLREAGDGGRAIALLEQAREAAPPGSRGLRSSCAWPTRWRISARAKRSTSIARRSPRLKATRPSRPRSTSASPASCGSRRNGIVVSTHAELAVEAASRDGDAALRCRALATFGLLHFRGGRGIPREQMEEALALERSLPEWPLTGEATAVLAFQLVWSGELERARRLLEESARRLERPGGPRGGRALWLLSVLEWRAGNWELAARHAADSLALRAQFGREGGSRSRSCPPR